MDKAKTGGALPSAVFSKEDTAAAKGAAACLLLCHHLYMGVLPAPVSLFGGSPLTVFATLSKVCVAMFALLSGYGLAVSYGRGGRRDPRRFTLEHVLGLMRPFWLVFIIFFILDAFLALPGFAPAEMYGGGARGALAALIDFLGLRPLFGTGTINQTWWYIEAALVLYLCFPFVYLAAEKCAPLALAAAAVPPALYFFLGNNEWDTCREIYCFLPFTAGVFLRQRGLPDRFAAFSERRPAAAAAASTAAMLAFVYIRAKIGQAADAFFAASIIFFLRATVCRASALRKAAAFIGRYSGDIFLTHSFFYSYFTSQHFFTRFLWSASPLMKLAAFPLLMAASLAAAVLLALLRKVSGWGRLFSGASKSPGHPPFHSGG